MNSPLISVIIATYNSADRIEMLKQSLSSQLDEHGEPWGDRLGVLCVDGGSTDSTRELAAEAQWTVLDNPAGDPANAKVIGWEAATSDLIVFLDHDEVLLRTYSLARKRTLIESHPSVVAVFSSGYYINNLDAPDAYLSEFGDAFSCFAYRSRNSSSTQRRLGRMHAEARLPDAQIYDVPRPGSRVLLEIAAQGVLVSRARLARSLGEATSSGRVLLRGAGLTNLAEWARVALLEDDPVGHDPRASWSSIRAKATWRLHNNLRPNQSSGAAFHMREGRRPTFHLTVLFLAYLITIFPLVLKALMISFQSRKNYFFGHIYLSLALPIDALRVLGGRQRRRYGM